MNLKEQIKEDFSLMVILLIPVAIAINTIAGQLTVLLKLPVYLDSIGTILISVLAGPWVGMATGALSNLINGIFDPGFIPFTIVSVIVGLLTGILSQKLMFSNVLKTFISGIILGIMAALVSTPIVVYVYGGITASGSTLITAVLMTAGKTLMESVLTSSILTDLADKIISVFVVFTLMKAMPSRYLSKFSCGKLYSNLKK